MKGSRFPITQNPIGHSLSSLFSRHRGAQRFTGLVRPIGIEFGIVKPFNPEVDDSGAFWMYHAGIDFAVTAGADVFVSHDGTVAAGTDSSLGDYVVGANDVLLWVSFVLKQCRKLNLLSDNDSLFSYDSRLTSLACACGCQQADLAPLLGGIAAQVISGPAGTTLYAPVTSLLSAAGSSVTAGAVLGKTTAAGFLHFTYTPNGDAFVMAAAVDPNPCFCELLFGLCRAGTDSSSPWANWDGMWLQV
jgi:hypothetical protein